MPVNKKRIFVGLFLALFGTSFIVSVSGQSVSAAPASYYRNSPLIDDSVYLNARTMSADQIQQFLVGKSSSLANFYVTESSTTETLNYYPNYNKSVLVSQAIYDAAQVYGINPQAILATMQKEESLITDPNPSNAQLKYAMGYGCPDSSGCGTAAGGMFYQIDNGTWDLRYLFERARGNNTWWNNGSYPCNGGNRTYYTPGLFPGNNVSFYDDYNPPSANPRSAYTTFVIDNAATAAMYCYTPHAYPGSGQQYYSGSYNFVTAFTSWFGSTRGSLWRTASNSDLFYVDGFSKYIVPSMDIAAQYGLGANDVKFVSQSDLDAIPLATNPNTSTLGILVKSNDDSDADGGAVYIISSGSRIPVVSLAQLQNFSLASEPLRYMPLNDLQRLTLAAPLSDYLQAPDQSVYRMVSGKLSAIFELSKLAQLNPSGQITPLSSYTLSMWNFTDPQIDGDYIVIGPDSGVRVYNAGKYYNIGSMDVYGCWGLKAVKTFVISNYTLTNGTSMGTLNCFTKSTAGNVYLMGGNQKYPLPNEQNIVTSKPSDALIAALPTTTLQNVIKGAGGELSVLENNILRPIPNLPTLFNLGYTYSDIQTLSSTAYSSFGRGSMKFTVGSLALEPGGGVSVISSSNTRLQIMSVKQFEDFGYSWSWLTPVGQKETTAYASSGNLSNYVKIGTDVYYVDGKVRYLVPSAIDGNLGIDRANVQSIDQSLLFGTTLPWNMTKFIKAPDNPAVYELQAGVKRPLASWEVYIRESGNRPQDLLILTAAGTAQFPTGTALN